MNSKFNEDFGQKISIITKYIDEINIKIQQKNNYIKENKKTYEIDKDLRNLLTQIKLHFQDLLNYIKEAENTKNLTNKELERRNNQINKLAHIIKDLPQKCFSTKTTNFSKETNIISQVRDESYDNLTNDQLLARQKENLTNQEEHIDTLLDTVITIKNIGNNINSELEEQKGLLTNLDTHIDKNAKQMKSTSSKLDKVIQTTSNSCFFCIIALEILIIILILILF